MNTSLKVSLSVAACFMILLVTMLAGRAKEASLAAASAKKEAVLSGEVMWKATAAMGEIKESSGKIGQIIVAIEEISFQTNLWL